MGSQWEGCALQAKKKMGRHSNSELRPDSYETA